MPAVCDRVGADRDPRCALKPRWNTARALRWLSALGLLSCLVSGTRRADAADGQWQAGGRAGAAWLSSSHWGPVANVFLRHGLAESLYLDVDVSASFHPFQPDAKLPENAENEGSSPWMFGFAPGLVYRWDVLQWVPFAGAGVGVYWSDGLAGRDSGAQFGVSGRAGVEYLISRDVVLSAQASAHWMLTESPLPAPWVQVTAGAGYVWGW